MHLLLVDDNPHMRQMLRRVMEKAGYTIAEANDGLDALQKLEEHSYDLMILDMQMPGMDGVGTMEAVSQRWPGIQIIVLTGNPKLENAIAAIKANAVDYFVKPVNLFELVAAVSRHASKQDSLRQQQIIDRLEKALQSIEQTGEKNQWPTEPEASESNSIVSVPPVTLDTKQRLVTFSPEQKVPIKLSRGETAVFRALLAHPEKALSCEQIASIAWGYQDLSKHEAENIIRPYISRLRAKLEPTAKHPRYVQTVRGRGYRFTTLI